MHVCMHVHVHVGAGTGSTVIRIFRNDLVVWIESGLPVVTRVRAAVGASMPGETRCLNTSSSEDTQVATPTKFESSAVGN